MKLFETAAAEEKEEEMMRSPLLAYSIAACCAALLLLPPVVDAAVECTTNQACETAFWKGSECRQGFCSNPFEKGCLYNMLQDEEDMLPSLAKRIQSQVRVCNSEDPPNAAQIGLCVDHSKMASFGNSVVGQMEKEDAVGNMYSDYGEVRILSQNWESGFFSAWILQIILSEFLQVPATIETGTATAHLNFYSPTNDFGYGTANDWGAIKTANEAPNSDCTLLQKQNHQQLQSDEEYVSCGHVIPEFWPTNRNEVLWDNHREGVVDAPEGLGTIGQQGIFVTKFTAEAEPTLLNLLGIAGEANRRKMAETFLRPTTFQDYCQLVSESNCTVPDGVAERPPAEESEEQRMHIPNVYTGYFRKTEKNDCDLNPTTCTGHIADFPCAWGSYLKQQIYHNNIAVSSDGKEPVSFGYSYSQMVEMYAAANATRSNLMIQWWQPEAMYSAYLGTEAEMQRVVLPTPTQECLDNRINADIRCEHDDPEHQYGTAAGACDENPQLLQKLVASSLYDATYANSIPEAKISPAYEAVKAFKITELQLGSISMDWNNRRVDTYGFDPRLATCKWVRDNFETLEDFIPRTYPRVAEEENILDSAIFYVAVAFGAAAITLTIITAFLTFRRRNGYVMRFSQVEFLYLLLCGLLLVSVGSILLATPPTNGSCIAITWFVGLGYTLELVPLIVKVGAMNKLMSAAKKMKRIVLRSSQLYGSVALMVVFYIIFLILWTAMDTPHREGEFTLTDDTTENGEYIVTVSYFCSSNSDIWRYLAVVWHCMLLVCATVLAFQTRNLQAGFSETHVLALMVYSHFVFVLLRVFSYLLESSLSESLIANVRSLIYSTDAIFAICVYFVPKLLKDDDEFYTLTHPPAARRDERETSKSKNRSSSGGSSKRFAPDGFYDEAKSEEAKPLQVTTAHSHKSSKSSISKSKAKRSGDVLRDDRVSWGGAHITEYIEDDDDVSNASSSRDFQEEQALVRGKQAVDELKDRSSWGAALVDSNADLRDDDEEVKSLKKKKKGKGNKGAREQSQSEHEMSESSRRRALLAPAVLPKKAPARFGYASSRINRMRDVHTSEIEEHSIYSDDESC